jgi:tetratricopeptide (TPR) repeat protein
VIDRAFISGRAGVAYLVEDSILLRIDLHEDGEPRPSREGEAAALAAMGAEFEGVPPRELSLDGLRQQLQLRALAYQALTFAIGGMDSLLARDIRREAIEAAEELLADPERAQFVRNRLLGCPVAEDGDPEGAAALAAESGSLAIHDLYRRISDLAKAIPEVRRAWGQLRRGATESEALDMALAPLVDCGAFAAFATAVAENDHRALHDAVINYGTDPFIQSAVPRSVHLLWNLERNLESLIGIQWPAETSSGVCEEPELGISLGDPILDLIASLTDATQNGPQARPGADEAKERVDKQIEAITDQLRQGHLARARRYLLDLVRFQIQHSRRQHLVMTFCALAAQAIASHALEFAAQLLAYAAAVGVEDPVIGNTHAELLRKKGQLEAALAAYDAVIERFPNDAVAGNGRAEVLKERGELEAALAAYDAAIERFPDDAVARNGRAEVLKERGELEAALAAYDAVIERFPNDVVACNGRAEVLKERGELEAALAAYDAVIERFPNNVVARNGRAEVLKERGELEAALAAYDAVIERFPDNVVARAGRAEVLKERGELEAALAAYDAVIEEFPYDAIARNARASVLILLGRLDEARASLPSHSPRTVQDWIAYHVLGMAELGQGLTTQAISRFEYGLTSAPSTRQRAYFANALAVARLRDRHFREAREALLSPHRVPTARERAKSRILLMHAQAGVGDVAEAAVMLQESADVRYPKVVLLRSQVARRFGLLRPATALTANDRALLDSAIDQTEFELALAA